MKTTILTTVLMLSLMSLQAEKTRTFYDFKVNTLEGEPFDMSNLKGKKVLIVNTASKCGFTSQYEGLQAIYEKYRDKGFAIIGFPSNDFFGQEPGTSTEIRQFCDINYGVSFPLMEKVKVKGKQKHPVYRWLTSKEMNGYKDSRVRWNFQKYLIDENGKLVGMYSPGTRPDSPEIIQWIEE